MPEDDECGEGLTAQVTIALMGPLVIVVAAPFVKISQEFVDGFIELTVSHAVHVLTRHYGICAIISITSVGHLRSFRSGRGHEPLPVRLSPRLPHLAEAIQYRPRTLL